MSKKAKSLNDDLGKYLDAMTAGSILDSTLKEAINQELYSTGFPFLDSRLGGGLYPDGLYVVSGMTELETTAICQQMAENMANGGKDVIYFSLEASKELLILKSIARTAYQIALEKYKYPSEVRYCPSLAQISNKAGLEGLRSEEKETLEKAKERLRQSGSGKHLYYRDGAVISANVIEDAIVEHVMYSKKAPIIFVDYLQLLYPVSVSTTMYDDVRKNLRELRGICRKYHTPIIAIYNIYKDIYSSEITMDDFSDSMNTDFIDGFIGLQYGGSASTSRSERSYSKNDWRRDVKAFVLKQKNSFNTNGVRFKFFTEHELFSEEEYQH